MAAGKLKSFTLSELLIVMIITAIVVGMAFSVLRLVQKQIHTIQTNFDKSSTLALFEQRL
jgi:Tfp pilus assembly protein FimT